MKTTMEYMVGSTAIQIINTGKKIKVVDVEKETVKKNFLARLCITSTVGIIMLMLCFYVVNLQNTKVILDRQVYSLQSEIESLETENSVLNKKNDEKMMDYDVILTKAKQLGMVFPINGQTYNYDVNKSTAVRINSSQLIQ